MRLHTMLPMIAATALIMSSTSAFSDTTNTENFDPARMWECTQADGTSIYTNKERPGCKLMTLKPLSVVPSLDDMPTYRPAVAAAPHANVPRYDEWYQAGINDAGRNVSDWARDWHATVASSGFVQGQVCSMYGEWLNLSEKTRGGFFFGSDPSYGGDLSGQNRRGASYSFYDNARYVTLSKLFGQGFVPIGCP